MREHICAVIHNPVFLATMSPHNKSTTCQRELAKHARTENVQRTHLDD